MNFWKMKKQTAIALKQTKNFVQYTRLMKQKVDEKDITYTYHVRKILNETALILLKDFLTKHNIWDEFIRETSCRKTDFIENELPCIMFIGYAFSWSNSRKGEDFWRLIHNNWVKYISKELLKDVLLLKGYSINDYIRCNTIYYQ